MRRIMFVGQAPSRTGDPTKPVSGRIGRRLAGLLGWSMFRFLRCRRINLNEHWHPEFDKREGRQAARIVVESANGEDAVLLGGGVARCFGWHFVPLSVMRVGARRFLLLPHPSGLNRWWNRSENVVAASAALRRFCGC